MLKIGRSFNYIDIKILVELIKISDKRVNLQITDLDLNTMFNKENYLSQLEDPKGNNNSDFLQVVKSAGCYQLVKEMLKYGA